MTDRDPCRCNSEKRPPLAWTSGYRPDTCFHCLGRIAPEWTSNDETVATFFDALSDAAYPGVTDDKLPETFQRFRLECELRERGGRRMYGLRYLTRDNVRDALEEVADAAIYALFETLSARRAGKDPEYDLALTAAHHAFKAYEALAEMRAKERGRPMPPVAA